MDLRSAIYASGLICKTARQKEQRLDDATQEGFTIHTVFRDLVFSCFGNAAWQPHRKTAQRIGQLPISFNKQVHQVHKPSWRLWALLTSHQRGAHAAGARYTGNWKLQTSRAFVKQPEVHTPDRLRGGFPGPGHERVRLTEISKLTRRLQDSPWRVG